MERLGSGISFMIREMRALGRPEPEFREQNEFVVTFRLAPGAAETIERAVSNTRAAEAPRTGGSGEKRTLTMGERQELALRHVQEHGVMTNKLYRTLTGVSDMTALRDLEVLVTRGSLRAVGQGRGRTYRL